MAFDEDIKGVIVATSSHLLYLKSAALDQSMALSASTVENFGKNYKIVQSIPEEELEKHKKIKDFTIVQIKFCSKQNLLFVITLGTISRLRVH